MKQPKKQCAAVENGERCPLDVHAGQYCNKHYRRWKLNGTLEARPMGRIQTCQVEENGVLCGLPAKHKKLGLCAKHLGRYMRHGTTQKSVAPQQCSEDTCNQPVRARGKCHTHLMQFYRARQKQEAQGIWIME